MKPKDWLMLFVGFIIVYMATAFVQSTVNITNPLAAWGVPAVSAAISTPLWVFVVRKYIVKKDQ